MYLAHDNYCPIVERRQVVAKTVANKTVKIVVATHKEYSMPSDDLYFPLQVGAALSKKDFGYAKDNTGKNISEKNPNYCELTGLYWAWKNLDADYIGLVHYRRHFRLQKSHSRKPADRLKAVVAKSEVKNLLETSDIILPKQRNYFIENLYDHYAHTMHIEPLDIVGEIIAEKYSEYSAEFEKIHARKKAHMFNMFIMKRNILDSYCEWLFGILSELEKHIDMKDYDAFHARFYGRISELLLDVYINTNHLSYTEVPIIDIEPVNWLKKGSSFLLAKFAGRKYEKSF
ncbi:MAG: DUF4422 domain-containing protein [Candidatus Saccharibacteria bacterium]|nr:DUF4422 domain-containing protein [Candidatus Saccharibacteria bacterium]